MGDQQALFNGGSKLNRFHLDQDAPNGAEWMTRSLNLIKCIEYD